MFTLFVYIISLSMLPPYFQSVFRDRKKEILIQQRVLQNINSEEFRGGVSKEGYKKLIKFINLSMLLWYSMVFAISGFVMDTPWTQLVAALLIVSTVHNCMKANRLFKEEKIFKTNVIEIFMAYLGFAHMLYFINHIIVTRLDGDPFYYFVTGVIIGLICIRSFNKVKKQEQKVQGGN